MFSTNSRSLCRVRSRSVTSSTITIAVSDVPGDTFDPEEVVVGLDECAARRRLQPEQARGHVSQRELRPRVGERKTGRRDAEQPLRRRVRVVDQQRRIDQDDALGKSHQRSLGHASFFLPVTPVKRW